MSVAGGKKPSIFTEATLIPVSLVISLLLVATWISSISSQSTANARDIEYVRDQRLEADRAIATRLRAVEQNVSKIDGQVSYIYEWAKEERAKKE